MGNKLWQPHDKEHWVLFKFNRSEVIDSDLYELQSFFSPQEIVLDHFLSNLLCMTDLCYPAPQKEIDQTLENIMLVTKIHWLISTTWGNWAKF